MFSFRTITKIIKMKRKILVESLNITMYKSFFFQFSATVIFVFYKTGYIVYIKFSNIVLNCIIWYQNLYFKNWVTFSISSDQCVSAFASSKKWNHSLNLTLYFVASTQPVFVVHRVLSIVISLHVYLNLTR